MASKFLVERPAYSEMQNRIEALEAENAKLREQLNFQELVSKVRQAVSEAIAQAEADMVDFDNEIRKKR